MEPSSREVARIESQGVIAVVEWEPRTDGYDVTVTGQGITHTYHEIPYIAAALHQAVDGILTVQMHG